MKEQINSTQAIEKFLLRINTDLKKRANKKAKSENRSLNGYLVNLVKTDLQP